MTDLFDQLLPSLGSFGIWGYWLVAAAVLLEAFSLTGPFVPGTLVVVAGGVAVREGALDFFDLAWFAAAGSFVGLELSFLAGLAARHGLSRAVRGKGRGEGQGEGEHIPSRAVALFERWSGAAILLGRFLGPLSGFIALAAALSGMAHRRFVVWSFLASLAYGLVFVAIGAFLGEVAVRFVPLVGRIGLLVLAIAALLGLLWWLVARILHMLPLLRSIARSVARAIAENPDVRAWAARHPQLARFLRERLDPHRPTGLTATLLGLAIIYVLFVWIGSALDFLLADPIVAADERLARLIHAFWTPTLLRFFAHVTALGEWRVVASLLVVASVLLWLRGRADLLVGLLVATAGNVLTVGLLKLAFDRPRPKLAYFVETTGSFPSGHAAISVAFYGMLFFIAWRLRLLSPLKAALLSVTTAFILGMSRLYLIEHYLTDILNGWLVGTLWMLIGISVSLWWQERGRRLPPPASPPLRRVLGALAVLLLGAALWQIATYDKARQIPPAESGDVVVEDIPEDILELFAAGVAPNTTESVIGTPLEPVNILILAPDEAQLIAAVERAGWKLAEEPSLAALAHAGLAALVNQPDDIAPVTPYFWNATPNDLAFEKPAAGPSATPSVRKRHHVRFWRTRFITPAGDRLFVGTASFDDGLDWQLLHHIDPDVDAERDTLVADLERAGVVRRREILQLSKARLGTSVAGDPWFTDGKAALLEIATSSDDPAPATPPK